MQPAESWMRSLLWGAVVALAVVAQAGAAPLEAAAASYRPYLIDDIGQALAALCVAGIALDRRWLPLRRVLTVGTRWLRRLHSGLVGDQVTWLTAGLALLAALGEWALH